MTTRHNSDTRFIPDGLTTPTIVQDFANEQSAREVSPCEAVCLISFYG